MLSRTLLLALLPVVYGHIGMWHPSALDFNGDGYTLVTPLSGKSFNDWWFHGNVDKPDPQESFKLPAGQTVTVELACSKEFSSYGNGGDGNDACPTDVPSYHAGTPIDQNQVLGCGLAIAYKSAFADVKPEDFTIFSVNDNCVTELKTPFDVPQGMPACPEGGCICSWFWQGQSSDNEMYMTGFRCNVDGGSTTATIGNPQPPKYCPDGGCVEGPKQPMYWANDRSNIDFSGDYDKKPSYNSKWGFKNGAQNDIISGGGASTPPADSPTADSPTASGPPSENPQPSQPQYTTLATITRKPSPTQPPTQPPTQDCSWVGHCAGAQCSSNDDCSDSLVCNSGVCGAE